MPISDLIGVSGAPLTILPNRINTLVCNDNSIVTYRMGMIAGGHILVVIIVNCLGIAITALGSFLAWYFLGQIKLTDEDSFLKGESKVTIPNSTPELRRKLSWNRRLSKLGIALIFVGSIIQIACSLTQLFDK